MPLSPLRPCSATCPNLTRGGRCPQHQRSWRSSQPEVKRHTGRWLQQQREALFNREPLCRICRAAGRTTKATIRDHIIPLAEGGSDVEWNTQPLCRSCSDTKTQQEAKRGMQRARQYR